MSELCALPQFRSKIRYFMQYKTSQDRNEILRGWKIFLKLYVPKTYDERLDNWEGLILLDSLNMVLQTHYKRRTSHYFSSHIKTTCVQYKIHPDNSVPHFLIVIYAHHMNAFHSPEVFLLYSVCCLE